MDRTIAASSASTVMPLDERAVDLDLGHREPLEVDERRVAGAEVVQAQLDAEPAQLASSVCDIRAGSAISTCSVISSLRAPAGSSVVAQQAGDDVGEAAVAQVAHARR